MSNMLKSLTVKLAWSSLTMKFYKIFVLVKFIYIFQIEAKILLAKIVQKFNIHIDTTQSFEVMETATLKPKDGCRCALTLREK